MEKINLVEILKDCPLGMELDCTIFNNVTFGGIDSSSSYPIEIKIGDNNTVIEWLTEFGEWSTDENSKCVIFPKGKTTWEGFIPLYKFKEGDVIFKRNFITIIHLIEEEGKIWYHCWFNTKYENYKLKKGYGIGNINDGDEVRLATEEEKAKLFKVIKENGYTWNAENKSLEKLIEPKFKVGNTVKNKDNRTIVIVRVTDEYYNYIDQRGEGGILYIRAQNDWELVPNKFDITTLKPFESKVLVRDDDKGMWHPSFWGYYEKCSCVAYDTVRGFYNQCIPYEGNEHLLGKTDDCDEFYKTWK